MGARTNNQTSKFITALTLLSITTLRVGVATFRDFPQLFEDILIKTFDVGTVEVSYLYTAMAIPNTFCGFLGSFLMSKIGLGFASIFFALLPFGGVVASFIGLASKKFEYFIFGRILLGLGFENTLIAQTVAAETFFSKGYLTVILALNRCVSNIAASLIAYFTPLIFFNLRSLEPVLFAYGLAGFLSVFAGLFLTFRELRSKRNQPRKETKDILEEQQEQQEQEDKKLRRFKLRDFGQISALSWALFIGGACYLQGYFQFLYFGTDFLEHRLGIPFLKSKDIMSVVPIQNFVMIPVFALLAWRFGRKGLMMLVSSVILCAAYGYALTLPEKATETQGYIFVCGVCLFWNMLISIIWSSFIITIPEQAVGVMLGLVFSLQNIITAVFPPIFGYVNKERNYSSYQMSLWILLGYAVFLVLLSITIVLLDFKNGGLINMREGDEKVKRMRQKMNDDFEEAGLNSERTVLDESLLSNGDLGTSFTSQEEL